MENGTCLLREVERAWSRRFERPGAGFKQMRLARSYKTGAIVRKRKATMPARRSQASSAILRSIHKAFHPTPDFADAGVIRAGDHYLDVAVGVSAGSGFRDSGRRSLPACLYLS